MSGSMPILPRTAKRIGVAADHGGYELKEHLVGMLRDAGHDVIDFGDRQPKLDDDYPDFVVPLARAIAGGKVERGVAICGSGVGASVAANKVAGVRACLIHENFSAHQGVEDDDLNLSVLIVITKKPMAKSGKKFIHRISIPTPFKKIPLIIIK